MPYGPGPVSQGGNRGIDEEFTRRASNGMYRLVGVDTFDGEDWVENDFDTLADAKSHALERVGGKEMFKMHIYDDEGVRQFQCGTS